MQEDSNTLNKEQLNKASLGDSFDSEAFIAALTFNEQGLIPAIAQQHDSGEVLMMAWMNVDSIKETLKTKQVCYWSRSRQDYWRKGESSGQVQTLVSMHTDCDRDTLLIKVKQAGAACHTGRRDCFYFEIDEQKTKVTADPIVDPATLYS